MAETEKKIEAIEAEAVKEVVEATNPIADAPKKNAVAAEPSHIAGKASYEDLGAPVVKPTDSNPDATKKSKKVSNQVNAKAEDADASSKPDTQAGVTKVTHPGQSEKVEETEVEASEDINEEEVTEDDKIDVTADVDALVKDEDLSEEFKSKAATIFEAAVNTKVKEAKMKMKASYDAKMKEEVEVSKGELVEKVDSYLNYVVEEWMKENELALEKGIKGEIAEDFISGLKKLFEDHYIDVPDEKYNVLEDQASKIEELQNNLNEEIQKNIELSKANGDLKRQDIIDEMSSDLADTAKEKFNSLSEQIEYSNEEDFRKKVVTIKESYFGKKEPSGDIDNVAASDVSDTSGLSNAMAAYSAAISKTKDIKLSIK
jgi:hypothetical protein